MEVRSFWRVCWVCGGRGGWWCGWRWMDWERERVAR